MNCQSAEEDVELAGISPLVGRLAVMLGRSDWANCDAFIIVPPGADLERPAFGPHMLATCAQQVGLRVRIVYANMIYALAVGIPRYSSICHFSNDLWGERVFSSAAYGTPLLGRACQAPRSSSAAGNEQLSLESLRKMAQTACEWADQVSSVLAEFCPQVVGCTSMFQQNASSVALLDRIKRLRPDCIAIMGGANCEGDMAEGVLTLCNQIDYAFSGESEESFPEFLYALRGGNKPSRGVINGAPIRELDELPLPDYTDYFEQFTLFLPDNESHSCCQSQLTYETSRGCWWGQKQHCTFCGLNGLGMQFRAKSPEKVLDDLRRLVTKYPDRKLLMCDNIMPHSYFRTLLPRLANELPELDIFYEQKSNLTLEQVMLLQRAGIHEIQPGIESLSTPLLKRMKKGVSARQNIALLRYARAAGISLSWNILCGFPGDCLEEYEPMLSLLPMLRHLQPPSGVFPVSLDRFSPYFLRAQEFGITDIRPPSCYQDTLPSSADAGKVTFRFDAEFESESRQSPEIPWLLQYEVDHWRQAWSAVTLPVLELTEFEQDQFMLKDTRRNPNVPEITILNPAQATMVLTGVADRHLLDVTQAIEQAWIAVQDGALIPLVTAAPELLARFEQSAYGSAAQIPLIKSPARVSPILEPVPLGCER